MGKYNDYKIKPMTDVSSVQMVWRQCKGCGVDFKVMPKSRQKYHSFFCAEVKDQKAWKTGTQQKQDVEKLGYDYKPNDYAKRRELAYKTRPLAWILEQRKKLDGI